MNVLLIILFQKKKIIIYNRHNNSQYVSQQFYDKLYNKGINFSLTEDYGFLKLILNKIDLSSKFIYSLNLHNKNKLF